MQVRKMLLIILVGWLVFLGLTLRASGDHKATENFLRLHVRANSDAPSDQFLKYQVRDAVLTALAGRLAAAGNLQAANAEVAQLLPEVLLAAQLAVKQAGYGYTVSASLGEAAFPTRLYGGQVYQAGSYQALQIYLGQGRGENWWCVLFPPLCFVEVAPGRAIPVSGQGAPPPPKSRLLEWWQQFAGKDSA